MVRIRIKNRGNGQGTAYKVKAGCYKAIATVGYKDGDLSKPVRRTKSGFKTKAEALAYIPELRKSAAVQVRNITLAQAYEKWFPTLKCSQSTKWNYQGGFKVFSDVKDIFFADQEIDELQACIDNCGKGKRTQQVAKVALGLIYKWAIPRGYVSDNLNLAQYLRVNDSEKKEKRGLSETDLLKIKKSIGTIPYAEYVYCHCYLGFRPSAFLSLKVADYHVVAGRDGIKIEYFVGGIKTEAGKNRIVTVSPKIHEYIERLVQNAKGGYVFGTGGEQLTLSAYRDIFYDVLARSGVDNPESERDGVRYKALTPHSCRHTFATLMKSVPAPDKDKLELMGHTSTQMLMYYEDVNPADLKKITDKI